MLAWSISILQKTNIYTGKCVTITDTEVAKTTKAKAAIRVVLAMLHTAIKAKYNKETRKISVMLKT